MSEEPPRAALNLARQSVAHRPGSFTVNARPSKRSIGSMARAYKLAQYFRIIPCFYSEQIFCFAACLLKWFRLEAMRQEALAATMVKGHHADRHATAGGPSGGLSDAMSLKAPSIDVDDASKLLSEGIKESHNLAPPMLGAPQPTTEMDTELEPKTARETEEYSVGLKPHPSDRDGIESGQEEERTGSSYEERNNAPDRPIYGSTTKSVLTKIVYANARERRDTYRLAFSTMKYYDILQKLLDEITFFMEYPDLKDEEYLVFVLAYDYAMRNFQRRVSLPHERSLPTPERYFEYMPNNNRLILYPPGGELFKTAETAVQSMCMRMAAAVARVRVRSQVGSLRLLLPEEWRTSEQLAEVMPTYGWYNQLLGKQDIVTGWLKDHGFRRIMAGRLPQPLEYASDKHCSDVFIFNRADVSTLLDSEIVTQKNLVLQDKSTCLGVHCCLSNVAGGEEVLFVNCINVYCAVHMEGLIGNKFPLIQPVPQIRCIRALKEDEDTRLITKMGSKVIKASTEEFLSLEPNNEKNKSIRHIFIEANDTRSAVVNPIGFIEVEADDLNILRDMWTPPGNTAKDTRRGEMINKTSVLLKHALKCKSGNLLI
ncbi:Methyltransferase NSUN7 [Paragonimus kellicotti]|nr:Methyltransferase NSUN7 [Paragonimus kellicotti]